MPEGLTYGYVVGRVFLALGDTPEDPDRLPDLVPPEKATVNFTPLQPQKRTQADGAEITTLVLKQRISCRVNSEGYVVDPASEPGVWLVTGIYEVQILTQQLGDPPKFYVEVTEEHTKDTPLDLIQYVPNQVRPTIPLVVEGPIGPEGPQGEQGPKGAGLKIIGALPAENDLPVTGEIGDAYTIQGVLWTWVEGAWVNVGRLEGPKGDKGDPGSDATVTAGSGIAVTGGVVSAVYVSGSANNPHTSASATRNSDLPKNFWQCAIEPAHWLDGDEWIEEAL